MDQQQQVEQVETPYTIAGVILQQLQVLQGNCRNVYGNGIRC